MRRRPTDRHEAHHAPRRQRELLAGKCDPVGLIGVGEQYVKHGTRVLRILVAASMFRAVFFLYGAVSRLEGRAGHLLIVQLASCGLVIGLVGDSPRTWLSCGWGSAGSAPGSRWPPRPRATCAASFARERSGAQVSSATVRVRGRSQQRRPRAELSSSPDGTRAPAAAVQAWTGDLVIHSLQLLSLTREVKFTPNAGARLGAEAGPKLVV